ncbi:GtrA family protein [Rhodococcus sp. ABRD24]|uniref:GtrA family protein n=1 Tax=Rhodococcus sp. ABRD24 TaxID=2507582 RepID=UPI00103D622A|nr:GtrA family protein [Rhodococcus sp. ABRD24]QBJ95948.1 GtrA family protein [Rhodococcus sp. ABRD24]
MRSSAWERVGARRLGGEGWGAQLVRFALVGGSSNALYALSFVTLAEYGTFVANTVGVAVSTVLANELHRRRTFRAADRVHWFAAQWEAGALAVLGLILSSAVLALMHRLFPAASGAIQVLMVIGVSAVVGGMRFLVLRGAVFAPSR